MQTVVFNGSPAGPNSATNVIAEAFLRGAAAAGAETHNIFLADYDIKQCRGCFACWFRQPGRCVQQDDMERLLQLYNQADIVCLATPVYTWNMTALLKNFADRLIPLKSPKITEQQGSFVLQDAKAREQRFVVIANCGFPGDNNFSVLAAAMACCKPVLEIYRNCGRLLKSADPQIRATVERWLAAVEQAGEEMARQGEVSAAVREALAAPLMSTADYVKFLGM